MRIRHHQLLNDAATMDARVCTRIMYTFTKLHDSVHEYVAMAKLGAKKFKKNTAVLHNVSSLRLNAKLNDNSMNELYWRLLAHVTAHSNNCVSFKK